MLGNWFYLDYLLLSPFPAWHLIRMSSDGSGTLVGFADNPGFITAINHTLMP